jgi:hypothetical protein
MTLRAQGLVGTEGRRGGVPGLLRRLGAVQLDTISVLARSHELVAYARLGAIPRQRIERAYWNPRRPEAFEYWSHAACVLPIEEWPSYAFRRRAFLARGMRWHEVPEKAGAEILARLRSEGPLTATQLGGVVKGGGGGGGGPWWDWSESKIGVEWLLDTGKVICVRRTGWRRVYDLPERVLPPELLDADPSDAECVTRLAAAAARALGVVTLADLADYQRLRWGGAGQRKDGQAISAPEAAAAAGLVPVEIAALPPAPHPPPASPFPLHSPSPLPRSRSPFTAGKPVPAWADPSALSALTRSESARGRHRVTLLSPFDSLIWDRKRTLRMFGFEHSLEAYVPAAKRVHGYFTMPLLARGRLVGRVDPARSGRTLVARRLSLDTPAATEPMARALREAATWVGCDNVELGHVVPDNLEPRLRKALADLS